MLAHRPIKHNKNFAELSEYWILTMKTDFITCESHMRINGYLTNHHMVMLMRVYNWFHPDEETKQHKSVSNLLSTEQTRVTKQKQEVVTIHNSLFNFVVGYHTLHIVCYISVTKQKYLLWWLKLFLLPNLSCNTVKISTTLNSQPTPTITSLLNKLQLLQRLQSLTGNTTRTSAEMWRTYTISLTSCNDNVHVISFLTSIQYLIKRKSLHGNSLHTPFVQTLLLFFKHTQHYFVFHNTKLYFHLQTSVTYSK